MEVEKKKKADFSKPKRLEGRETSVAYFFPERHVNFASWNNKRENIQNGTIKGFNERAAADMVPLNLPQTYWTIGFALALWRHKQRLKKPVRNCEKKRKDSDEAAHVTVVL